LGHPEKNEIQIIKVFNIQLKRFLLSSDCGVALPHRSLAGVGVWVLAVASLFMDKGAIVSIAF
jgi:hypothetical protein